MHLVVNDHTIDQEKKTVLRKIKKNAIDQEKSKF